MVGLCVGELGVRCWLIIEKLITDRRVNEIEMELERAWAALVLEWQSQWQVTEN